MPKNKTVCFQDVLTKRINRRQFIAASSVVSGSTVLSACSLNTSSNGNEDRQDTNKIPHTSLTFQEVEQGLDSVFTVAEGYDASVLIRWGDPIFVGAPEFNPKLQSSDTQNQQFGFNNDFVGFLSLPLNSDNSNRGLLVVNHEYTSSYLMFEGSPSAERLTKKQTDTDIVAHGLSVVEIYREEDTWLIDKDSQFNRRITPLTPAKITGPAAGADRMKTTHSGSGTDTLGTYGNCAGGVTPWGTVLTGEENINYMFAGDFSQHTHKESLERFGMTSSLRKSWAKYYDRWNIEKDPNECFHAGWIVEIDPYDPHSLPKKRTALGRFKHEGCNVFINKDQRVVAYTGDDQAFEYLYKFVSENTYDPDNRAANLDILENGTLYCARFDDTGTVKWLPLTYGQAGLTSENGFHSQADVCLDTRKAADSLGATPMDRPEDVEVNPVNGYVYVMLTKNSSRTSDQLDGVNPRQGNRAGQIVELLPPDGDHTSNEFNWEMLLLAGLKSDDSTNYHPATTENGWLACPDNCAFDKLGNLWIATDGAPAFNIADGVWATELDGPNRALTKRFLRAPRGAELCGPFFTPDNESFFCSVQHPAAGSSFDQPSTRWPDFDPELPARPSVVVITKKGGGRVGS